MKEWERGVRNSAFGEDMIWAVLIKTPKGINKMRTIFLSHHNLDASVWAVTLFFKVVRGLGPFSLIALHLRCRLSLAVRKGEEKEDRGPLHRWPGVASSYYCLYLIGQNVVTWPHAGLQRHLGNVVFFSAKNLKALTVRKNRTEPREMSNLVKNVIFKVSTSGLQIAVWW